MEQRERKELCMTYVMSDLHGQYRLYCEMLSKIDLCESDTLYILGDFVDRGDDGVKILLDVMKRPNVKPLLGNHDWTMLALICEEKRLIEKLGREGATDLYRLWFSDGGRPTYQAIRALDRETRKKVLSFVADMNYIAEITVGDKKYFLSHTLPEYDPNTPLTDRPADEFIHGEPDYDTEYLPGVTTVTGHTPTGLIDPNFCGRIWQGNGHIAVDCGIAFYSTLGCICLDTMEEFYVKGDEQNVKV